MQRDVFDVKALPSLEGFTSDVEATGLRVLIATEEIIGPVRNGGIASTYYHLARGLAAQGHKVTVLYLKGRVVENETPEHWIEHYASFGIEFVYLPDLDDQIACASEQWQWRWLSFYRWLRDNDRFDAVHTSEWRGGAFYCLQAKRMGLAFQDTLFIMKTSSPYIWNRHYQMRPIDNGDLVTAAYAEQKCVEWADIVVGGSAHLLSFMEHIGYTLPKGRTYVQPNIVDFSEVQVEDARPERQIGDIVKTRELVFFGRLEPRKGLEVFVHAVDALVSKGIEIERISFLGKEGEKLPGHVNLKPIAFIEQHAERWPFPVEIVTDKNQPAALSYMCSRDMIAVMPSLIENSTMAVYETLVHKIPFIATRVGGTPELIGNRDHSVTLVAPNVQQLAVSMERALEQGQPVAQPAFDNEHNLEIWYGFHRYLAEVGHQELLPRAKTDPIEGEIAVVSVPRDGSAIEDMIASIEGEGLERVNPVLCITFFPTVADRALIEAARAKGVRIMESVGASTGECFNQVREDVRADIYVFDAAGSVVFDPAFFDCVRTALQMRPDDFITSLFRFSSEHTDIDAVYVPLGGDVATQTMNGAAFGIEMIAGSRAAFNAVGAFEDYRVQSGTVHEFVSRAVASNRELFVIPEPLFTFHGAYETIVGENPNCRYLVRKPILDGVNLTARKLLLMEPGQGGRGKARKVGPMIMANAHRKDDRIAWLTNVDKKGRHDDKVQHAHAMFLGFDKARGRLRVAVRHKGQLRVLVNRDIIRSDDAFDSHGGLSIMEFDVLEYVEAQARTHLRIELEAEQLRAAGVAIQKLDDGVYYLSSHRPIYWDSDFDDMIQRVREVRAEKAGRKARQADTGKANGETSSATMVAANDSNGHSDHEPESAAEPKGIGKRMMNFLGF